MKDDPRIEQLRNLLANWEKPETDALNDFDLGLVGFDCRQEIDLRDPWACPFQPGCGAKRPSDCPGTKQRVQILSAPKRAQ
jgi:hypothetical protein